MTDGERKREFKICAAEKLLLVKILFEEVSFKASCDHSDGKEGRLFPHVTNKRLFSVSVILLSAMLQ